MKEIKKYLCVCALFMMMLVCMSTSVSASTKTVATIGNKKYTSLQNAIDKVKNGQTIKLKANVKLKKDIVVNKKGISFTLDLNKKTLKEGHHSIIVKKGKMSIKNGSAKSSGELFKIGKSGKVEIKSGSYTGFMLNEGTLNIKNGTFSNTDEENSLITNAAGGKLTITNGIFQSYGNVVKNIGTAQIKNGIYKNTNDYYIPVIYNAITILTNEKGKVTKKIIGKMTIQNGDFAATSNQTSRVIVNSGKLTINGGNYNSSSTVIQNGMYVSDQNIATLLVSGGTFQAQEGIRDDGKKVTITGGMFENQSSYYTDTYTSGNLVIKGGIFKGGLLLPQKYSITFPQSEYLNHFFAEVRASDPWWELIYAP